MDPPKESNDRHQIKVRRPREVFMEYGYVAPEEREQRLLEVTTYF